MACNLGLHALCILMELTCFMAEWLKVNSPNRWDSLKTNLNFKHSFFSHCKAKAHNNRKVVFITTSYGSLRERSDLLPHILCSY